MTIGNRAASAYANPRARGDPVSNAITWRDQRVLEAMRRTTGWIVPVVAIAFLAYAYFGPYLPQPWTHRGFDVGQIVVAAVDVDPDGFIREEDFYVECSITI